MSYYMAGLGAYTQAAAGFGATISETFNAGTVWTDWVKGASGDPPGTGPGAGAAGKRAAQAIQAALNELGYGPIAVDGIFGLPTGGGESPAALKRFSQGNGFGNQNWPTEPIVIRMEELLRAGEKPGPAPVVPGHITPGGTYIPGPDPNAPPEPQKKMLGDMSTGAMIGLGALALLAVGGLFFLSKKKAPAPGPKPAGAL